MFKLLTSRWRSELARLQVEDMLTEDLAADLFVSQSEYDHPIAKPQPRRGRPRIRRTVVAKNCRHSPEEILGTAPRSIEGSEFLGASNNWVVSGKHTASGQAMLANDMHLPHTVPAVWFMNHLSAPDMEVTGFSLPGLPFVIVGHNRNIAWGFTNLGADVQDLYLETFNPDDPSRYLTPQGWQTATQRKEVIKVRGQDDVEIDVFETRHGPIIHDDGEIKLALQWTARDAGQLALSPAFLRVNRASNWQEFTSAMALYGGPAQNAVYADREGHIGYHAIGHIPRRQMGSGYPPRPGDTPDFDWVGYVPFEQMPQNYDPPGGVLATANNRVVPKGFPIHITDRWMNPSRVHRINLILTDLIEKKLQITPQDMLRLQGDTVSLPNLAVAKYLLAAAESVDVHPAQRQKALKVLLDWDGQMDAGALAPVIADMARRRLLRDLLEPKLGEDWHSYNWWMAPVFLENILRNRPAGWLPLDQPGYDEFLLDSFDRALEDILTQTRAPSLDHLRWGDQMQLRMTHPVGDRLPFLRSWFSRTGHPQSGGRYTVKQTGRGFGPSERMVVDFGNLDASLLNTTLGQSGHILSPHYADQFTAWQEIVGLASPFTEDAVQQATRHTLYLRPQ
jgi:penicillin amidase